MKEVKKIASIEVQEHLSEMADAPLNAAKRVKHGKPKSAGNRAFRRHNNLRFMITERRRKIGKGK